jgi:hypothetical protein
MSFPENIQAEDVAADKDLGQPVDSDQRVFGRVCAADEAAENHVDGSCEEDGGQEDERGLDDVGCFAFSIVVGCRASGVSYSFALGWVLARCFLVK